MFRLLLFLLPFLAWGSATQVEIRDSEGECLPADNSINTGPSEIILNKSPRLCHREMDASPQSRWLLGSGEGTRTESRVPAAAIGARAGGERALAEQLEQALRANKRSAAPFSKGEPKSDPKPPGRKPGAAYGQRATRPVPSRVDEQIPVPLPPHCPHCHGPVILNHTQPQYQEDILRMTIIRRFDVEVGRCACCGRQAQGRHPLQTSDSLRVGEVQVGPEALSMAAVLNKELGLSHARTARVLELGYGLKW